MMRRLTVLALLFAGILPGAYARDLTGNETEIRALISNFVAAWNRHDVDGLAAQFSPDADCSDPWGTTAKGRDDIARMVGDREGFFATTTFKTMSVSIRFVSGDAALVELGGRIDGLSPPGASAPDSGRTISLIVSRNEDEGRWQIASIRSYAEMTPIAAPAPAYP